MSRTLVAVVAAAALAAALPSFAIEHDPEVQAASQPRTAPTSGGGVAVAFFQAEGQPATVPHEQFATGRVVMTTPSEVALHTKQGIREFAIASSTDETTRPYQGERVTVGYVPAKGSVQVAAATPMTAPRPVKRAVVAQAAPAQAPAQAWHAENATEPAKPATATTAEPAAVTAKPARPAARLPKTASDRPLLLLSGLLGLVAAGSLRLARLG
jgi:hypothetical protein